MMTNLQIDVRKLRAYVDHLNHLEEFERLYEKAITSETPITLADLYSREVMPQKEMPPI